MDITLQHYLAVGAILFTIGVFGIFVNRKNVIIILMSIELILLAVNINFVAFSAYLNDVQGQIMAMFVLTVAAAEARFAVFMGAAPAIAVIKDKQGRYVFANEHVVRTLGEAAPPWVGRTDYDLWPPAVAAQIRENDGVTLAGTAPREFVQTVPLADGPHTLLVYKFPLEAATGERLLGEIGLDVTDRARAATAERRSRRREAHALQLARDRALVADGLVRLRTRGRHFEYVKCEEFMLRLSVSSTGFKPLNLQIFAQGDDGDAGDGGTSRASFLQSGFCKNRGDECERLYSRI